MGLEAEIPVLTTTVEKMVQWARRSSIWPVTEEEFRANVAKDRLARQ